jgi:hypothetical protein
MIVYEGGPRLRGGPHARPSHVLLDRAFRNANAQFEQLPADALGTPQAIVERYRSDQRDGLERDSRLPRGRLGALPPEPAECLTMPAEESIGLDNVERRFQFLTARANTMRRKRADLVYGERFT